MQRRELLAGGAAAGLGAAALPGCAPAALPPATLPPEPPEPTGALSEAPAAEQMDAFCDDLERKLVSLQHAEFIGGFLEQAVPGRLARSEPAVLERIQQREALFRRGLRSLYLSQTFRELPPAAQQHPRLQALMSAELPEIDQSLFDMTEMLESLPSEERQALRSELGRRPDLPVHISEAIDGHAARAGVSRNRRRQLRALLTQASFRLRHAAPDTLIDEYTHKVRRATAPGGAAQALALSAAARASADLFFAGPALGTVVSVGASSPGAPGTPTTSTPRQPASAGRRRRTGVPRQPEPAKPGKPDAPGSGALRTGAWLLGIGVVGLGVSAAIVSAGGTAFVVGVTLGAIAIVIGLIALLVGSLTYAAS